MTPTTPQVTPTPAPALASTPGQPTPVKPDPLSQSTERRALRTIAAFEASKGLVALAASVGFLSLLHHDLRHLAEALIGHIGLDPGGHYPLLLLNTVDALADANARSVVLIATGYVALRWAEAWGLWFDRPWGEWLGALSGALYVPFEARHFLRHPTFAAGAVIGINIVLVCFLAWRLRRRPRA